METTKQLPKIGTIVQNLVIAKVGVYEELKVFAPNAPKSIGCKSLTDGRTLWMSLDKIKGI